MKRATAYIILLCMVFVLCACTEKNAPPEKTEDQLKEEIKQEILDELDKEKDAGIQKTDEAEEAKSVTGTGDEIRPEVKEFLDSYEEFMDEYVEFMNMYKTGSPNEIINLLGQYSEIMKKYVEFNEALDEFDTSSLNNAEMAYYIEVTSRVSQKLIIAAA